VSLFLTGLQGWIGSIVVSTNLLPGIITIHMILALVIMALLIWAVFRAYLPTWQARDGEVLGTWKYIGILAALMVTVQIVLGTQVREQVDLIAKQVPDRTSWIASLGQAYLTHRLFYYVLTAVLGYWLFMIKGLWAQHLLLKRWSFALVGILASEILLGITMHYFAIPVFAQPLHLTFATLLFVAVVVVDVYLWVLAGKGKTR
jgi:heme a synthase